jgi:tubby-related protein 1
MTSSTSFFGKRSSKEKKGSDNDMDLNYGTLYPVRDDDKLMSDPKDSGRHLKSEVMHSDEEFSVKDDDEVSDSDVERDSPIRDDDENSFSLRNPRKANNFIPKTTRRNRKDDIEEADQDGPSTFRGSQECSSPGFPNVLTAYTSELESGHVQCLIVRDRSGLQNKMYPTYELWLEDSDKSLIIAKKMNLNRTSNYHMFDMTRGQVGKQLSKKSGNYIGKLRSRNVQRTEYVVVNQASEREEVAGFMFDRLDVLNHMKEGSQPRKLNVIIPQLNTDGCPVPYRVAENDSEGSITDLMSIPSSRRPGMYLFETKEPSFISGNFRLNFRGRVSIPSVKNFQLVPENDVDNIICQFGKIDDDRFHLDFKAPFNAFQAFALALSQFNL